MTVHENKYPLDSLKQITMNKLLNFHFEINSKFKNFLFNKYNINFLIHINITINITKINNNYKLITY